MLKQKQTSKYINNLTAEPNENYKTVDKQPSTTASKAKCLD